MRDDDYQWPVEEVEEEFDWMDADEDLEDSPLY